MIFTTLNYLYCVEWFVLRWIICTTFNDMHSVEWFVQRWMIFYFLAKFVRPRMICTALKDLYYVEWFGIQSMICTTLNQLGYEELLSIAFLISARCAYSKKSCKIFYANLWVVLFLIWKYQKKIFSAHSKNLVIYMTFHFLTWCTMPHNCAFHFQNSRENKKSFLIKDWKSWKWEIPPHQWMDWKNSKFWTD